MSLTHRIYEAAAKALVGHTVNLSGLSELTGVRVATLWTYHHGKARWTADLWLASLFYIGAAKIVDGQLVIDLPELFEAPQPNARAIKPRKSK